MHDTTFHPFPRLPAEMRIQIWSLAAAPNLTNTSDPVCVFPENPDGDGVVFETGSPALFATSKEARQIALKCCIPRTYDPTTDILYVPSRRLPSFYRCCGLGHPPGSVRPSPAWVTEVRHLAIDHPCADLHSFVRVLSTLTSLKSISVIFPRSNSPRMEPVCLDQLSPGPRHGAGLHLQEALEVYSEATANTTPDRSYMQEFQSYYRRVAALWRSRDDRVKHWPWVDMDKMAEEFEIRKGKGLGVELASLEFELNKRVLQQLWQRFRYVQYVQRVPERPRLRYEARRFTW